MVLIMVFRPQGIISGIRQRYEFHAKAREEART